MVDSASTNAVHRATTDEAGGIKGEGPQTGRPDTFRRRKDENARQTRGRGVIRVSRETGSPEPPTLWGARAAGGDRRRTQGDQPVHLRLAERPQYARRIGSAALRGRPGSHESVR